MLEFIALLFKISTGLALFVIGIITVAHLVNLVIKVVVEVLAFFVKLSGEIYNIFWGAR